MATLASLVVKIVADATAFQQGLASAQKAIGSFQQGAAKVGSLMADAGKKLTIGVTAPLIGIGTAAAIAATDFDREMRNIQSISKASDAEIAQLSQTIMAMAQDITKTTDSAANLAAGFYQIQSSGFAGNDALKVLEASTKAASAGLTSTDVAAKAILATLNAYGMSAEQATHVSDVLFKTVDIGVLSFEELAMNLGDIVGTGNVAGVSIEQLGAAMATMTKGGISAAEAATALNQLMLSFISPSKEAQKAAEALGIELSAQALASKGLGGAMAEVLEKTGGSAEAMAALFPNVRALKAALALTRGEMKPFAADLEAIGGAAGATEKAFEIQTRSFDAQMKNLRNTLNVLFIELGKTLLPIVIDIAKALIPLVQGFAKLPEPVKKFIVVAGMIAAALGPILVIVGQVISAIGAIGGVVSSLAGVIGPAVAAIAVALGPVGMAILAIIAAVGLLYLAWRNNWLGIRDFINNLIPQIVAFLSAAWEWIKNAAITAWTALSTFFTLTWTTIQTTAVTIWTAISTFLSTMWTTIQTTAVNLWNQVKGTILGVLGSLVEGVYEKGRALASRFGEGIISKLRDVYEKVKELARKIRDLLPGSDAREGPLSDIFAAGQALPMTLAQGILAGQGALLSAANLQAANLARGVAMPEVRVAGVRGMAAAPSGGQNISVTINNPRGEPSEASITKQLRNLAYLGVLSPM